MLDSFFLVKVFDFANAKLLQPKKCRISAETLHWPTPTARCFVNHELLVLLTTTVKVTHEQTHPNLNARHF